MLWVVLAAVSLLPATGTPRTRVGVICAGEGAAALQPAVENRVAALPDTVVRGMADLAPLLAEQPPAGTWSTDAAARTESAALLESVQKEFYAGHLAAAQQKIDAAARLYEKVHDVPASVLVRIPFWRAAIKLKNGATAAADADLKIALTLSPDAVAGDEFPPTFPDAVAAAKKRLPSPFHLTLAGMPPGASAKLDDVTLDGSTFAAVAGPHQIEVSHPGTRSFSQVVEVSADATIPVVLVPALPAATETALLAFVHGTAVTNSTVSAIADRDHLDALVLVAADGEDAVASIWFRGKPLVRGTRVPLRSPGPLLDFVATTLKPPAAATPSSTPSPTPVVVATATPTPVPTLVAVVTPAATPVPAASPTPSPGASLNSPLQFHAEGGTTFLSIADTVSFNRASGGSGSYSLPLSGGGVALLGRMDGEEFGALASLTYISFGSVSVKGLPAGTTSVAGGGLTSLRIAGDYLLVGTRSTRQESLAVWVAPGVTLDLYGVSDPNVSGTPSGVFVPYARSALELRVGGSFALPGPHLLFDAEVAASGSTYAEKPDGVSGTNPKTGASPAGWVGAALGVGTHSQVCLDLSAQAQSVQFSGSGTSEFNAVNQASNVKRQETFLGGGLSFRYTF